MTNRRQFLAGAGVALGAGLVSKAALAALPESPSTDSPLMQPPEEPKNGRWYNPVVTLNGWSMPWRMKNGWKEFHLTAEAVEREVGPGMVARLWGYNGQSPGPTIESRNWGTWSAGSKVCSKDKTCSTALVENPFGRAMSSTETSR